MFGGIGPIAFHATGLERLLIGRHWDASTLAEALRQVRRDVAEQIAASTARMADVPDEGFTDEYRTHLAESFVYQFFVWVAEQVAPGLVGPEIRSAGDRVPRPVSTGRQIIQTYPDEYPVSFPFVKIDGFLQATGEARYTTDTPTPGYGAEAAFVVSTQALKTFSFSVADDSGNRRPATPAELATDLRQRFAGFVELVTATDVPGVNNQAGRHVPRRSVDLRRNDDGVRPGAGHRAGPPATAGARHRLVGATALRRLRAGRRARRRDRWSRC